MKLFRYILICCLLGISFSGYSQTKEEKKAAEQDAEKMVMEMFEELERELEAENRLDTVLCKDVQISCRVKDKVFRTKEEYRKNKDHSDGCISNIGYIDFEKNSLIGVSYSSASRSILKCNLVYDEANNTYYHLAIITQYGEFANQVLLKHWCLIPRLQEYQKVIFMNESWYKELEEYPQE